MSEHTKEPWVGMVNGKFNTKHSWEVKNEKINANISAPIFAGKNVVALVVDKWTPNESDNVIANAKRIVACVNACEGIPNETLESRMFKDSIFLKSSYLDQQTEITRLKNTNNELIEALEELKRAAKESNDAEYGTLSTTFVLLTITPALAKTKGME